MTSNSPVKSSSRLDQRHLSHTCCCWLWHGLLHWGHICQATLSDLKNSSTYRLSREFAIYRYVDIPPHLTYVATLPRETWMAKKTTSCLLTKLLPKFGLSFTRVYHQANASARWNIFDVLHQNYTVQSITRHCSPLSPSSAQESEIRKWEEMWFKTTADSAVLNHISSHFLIPLSNSSLICTVPAQWLVILSTRI